MVTEAIVGAIVGIIRGLIAPLPTYVMDTHALNAQSSQVGAMASALNGYAPIQQLGLALALLVGLKLALLAWQGIVFIYHQFWGSS